MRVVAGTLLQPAKSRLPMSKPRPAVAIRIAATGPGFTSDFSKLRRMGVLGKTISVPAAT